MTVTTTDLTGERVRELRTSAGLSQFQLAELTGLSRNTIQLVETGAPVTTRTRRLLEIAFPGLVVSSNVIEQIQRDLADLRRQVDALTSGQAA